jgi:hypothetical protein
MPRRTKRREFRRRHLLAVKRVRGRRYSAYVKFALNTCPSERPGDVAKATTALNQGVARAGDLDVATEPDRNEETTPPQMRRAGAVERSASRWRSMKQGYVSSMSAVVRIVTGFSRTMASQSWREPAKFSNIRCKEDTGTARAGGNHPERTGEVRRARPPGTGRSRGAGGQGDHLLDWLDQTLINPCPPSGFGNDRARASVATPNQGGASCEVSTDRPGQRRLW